MIIESEILLNHINNAFNSYNSALQAKRYLNHRSVYQHCFDAVEYIARSTHIIMEEEVLENQKPIDWVKTLPVPNALYPQLIKAVNELDDYSVPLLNFVISYPRSASNIYLIKDALEELLINLERKDEEGIFENAIISWKELL